MRDEPMKSANRERSWRPFRRTASGWSFIMSGLMLAGIGPLCLAQEADERPGEWRITPRLSLGMTYSDNISLAPADEAEGDLVLQVDPGVSIRKRGGRLDLRLDYTAQGLLYTQQGEANLNNNLLAFGTAELYQDHLFLDVYGSISQVPVTSGGRVDVGNLGFGGGGTSGGGLGLLDLNMVFDVLPGATEIFNPVGIFSNIALTDDQTTQANFGISPYWRQDFGGWAEGLLRYTYDDSGYGQNEFDSQSNSVQFDLNSGRRFSLLTWSLAYSYQQQDGQQDGQQGDNPILGGGNTRQESVVAQANYKLSNAWALAAVAGYEDNTGYEDNENGPYWAVGAIWSPNRFYALTGLYGLNYNEIAVQWNPSPRTGLQVSRTDQGVGTSPGVYWNGAFNYKTRFSTWSANYTQEVTTVQELLGNSLTGLGPDGQPIALDDQGQILLPGGALGLTNQPFLRKSFNVAATYRRGRNALGFNAFSENREFQDTTLNNEDTYGAGAIWTWRFAPRTASFLGTGWEHDDLGDDQQNDYWVLVLGLARLFTPDSGGLISYRYYQNDADPSDQGFRENRLNVRFSMKF
jgi:uncharacterized protein (PEP-CTERM system associated)